jgi:acetolactate synthase-1/2/3 large subunit
MDSVPLLAITGQVFSHLMGTDAFQEADIVGITMPITKHSFLVTKAEDIPGTLAAAYEIATTGRPGPVLVDITKDAQQQDFDFSWPPTYELPGYHPVTKAHGKQIQAAAELMAQPDVDGALVGGASLEPESFAAIVAAAG